jgi:hypothetical protein
MHAGGRQQGSVAVIRPRVLCRRGCCLAQAEMVSNASDELNLARLPMLPCASVAVRHVSTLGCIDDLRRTRGVTRAGWRVQCMSIF